MQTAPSRQAKATNAARSGAGLDTGASTGSDVFEAMVNQYLSHSMPKSAGNPALFLTKGSRNGFNKGWLKQVLTSPSLDSNARLARASCRGQMVGAERYVAMARTAAARFWSQVRACARTVRRCLGGRSFGGPSWLAAGLVLIGSTLAGVCQAVPVKGEATLTVAGGYARLVLKLAEDVESDVTTAGTILVIKFKRPIDIPIDRVFEAAPDYVTSPR